MKSHNGWIYNVFQKKFPVFSMAMGRYGETPVGSCTLLLKEDFRPDLGPWIGDLVVSPKYQKQGIGKMLVDVTEDSKRVWL